MRVVVTGFGLITAAGDDAASSWGAFLNARTGIAKNTIVPMHGVMSDRAGQVRTLKEDGDSDDRVVRLARLALTEAMKRAGLTEVNPYAPERRGLSTGTALGGARTGQEWHIRWLRDGLHSVHSCELAQYPLHALNDALAASFDLCGPRVVHSNACAAGAVAIANGYEYLLDNRADVVVAGGADPLAWLSCGGFSSLGVLSNENCAPYTRSDGITLGEGAGFLILEREKEALARGAKIYAELAGYGLSADAYHPTAPDPRGQGAVRAMDGALSRAGLTRVDVDYVNGHGTGTPANDSGEMKTIKVLSEGVTPMSSTKSMIGHTLGAAGAVEAVVSVMTLVNQCIHPTFVPSDDTAQAALATLPDDIDIVPNKARETDVSVVVSNSFAFGGNNASLLFTRYVPNRNQPEVPVSNHISIGAITGVAGTANSLTELERELREGRTLYGDLATLENGKTYLIGRTDPNKVTKGLNPRTLRRVDTLGRLGMAAVQQLVTKLDLKPKELADIGLVFATASGPLSTVEEFQRGLILERQGSNKLFPNTVMNAAAGHIAMAYGLKGPTATICSGMTSSVSALHFAAQMVAHGTASRIIVVAADEANETLLSGYSSFNHYLAQVYGKKGRGAGLVYTEGAVAVLVEAPDVDTSVRIEGMGMTGDIPGVGRIGADASAWARSFELAMADAGLRSHNLDVVISAANGLGKVDSLEEAALAEAGLSEVRIIKTKEFTGETQSAYGLLGIHLATMARNGAWGVEFSEQRPFRALVSTYGVGGNYMAYVVSIS